MKNLLRFFLALTIIIFLTFVVFVKDSMAGANLSITESNITFSKDEPLEGDIVRVFARVFNVGDVDVYGFVIFSVGEKEIVDPQPISVKVNTYDDVFIDWVVDPGDYDVWATITATNPSDADSANDTAVKKNYFVDIDTDGDKIGNAKDLDDDNDGLTDQEEVNLGTNPLSPDSDGDGLSDKEEKDLGTNPLNSDSDKDGLSDKKELGLGTDPLSSDSDGDGLSDKEEVNSGTNPLNPDTDEDGLFDKEELNLGTNPLKKDTDGDGVGDKEDVFPRDPAETRDTDSDGIGDNADTDDDNDGLTDEEEKTLGTDFLDSDTDKDGVGDKEDVFPLDPKEWKDSDDDGLGDDVDLDDDNDELTDEEELALGTDPFNPDSDGDWVIDSKDAFPLDPTKTQASMVGGFKALIEKWGLSLTQLLIGFSLLSLMALILFFSFKRKYRKTD